MKISCIAIVVGLVTSLGLSACAPMQTTTQSNAVSQAALKDEGRPTAVTQFSNPHATRNVRLRRVNDFTDQHGMSVEIAEGDPSCLISSIQLGSQSMQFNFGSTRSSGDWLEVFFVEEPELSALRFGRLSAKNLEEHVAMTTKFMQARHSNWTALTLPPPNVKRQVVKLRDVNSVATLVTYSNVVTSPYLDGESVIHNAFLVIPNLNPLVAVVGKQQYDVFAAGTLEGYIGGPFQAETVLRELGSCLQYKPRFRPKPAQVAAAG